MNREIKKAVKSLIRKIYMSQETCNIREVAGNWGCNLGNCSKCAGLAIEYIYQQWKERNEDATV